MVSGSMSFDSGAVQSLYMFGGIQIQDWALTKKRYEHWWANDMYDRALVQVKAPRSGVVRDMEWPGGEVTPEIKHTNVDYMVWDALEERRTTYYGGEALPILQNSWSVGHALPLGCEPRFGEDTVWVDPISSDERHPPLRFHREGRWWKWMLESTSAYSRASRGRFFVTPMWGNQAGDVLALVRGVEPLMMDLVTDRDWVMEAARTTSDIMLEMLNELWPLVGRDVTGLEGSTNYTGVWSPGRSLSCDCDISCMISPTDFESIFLPPLVETMRTVDNVIYHLDGPDAIRHLDALLSTSEVKAIQWVPGAGAEEIMQWVPLIRRIQGAGRSVQVTAQPAEVEPLLREVSARGLCINTSCETEQDVSELLKLAARASR